MALWSSSCAFAGFDVCAGYGWYWKQLGSNEITSSYVYSLAIAPSDRNTIYAGSNQSGMFKSTDGGATWVNNNSGTLSGATIYSIAVDPITPNIVYAGTSQYQGFEKLADSASKPFH